MTGTSVNNKDADVLLIQEVFNLLVINEWDRKQPLCQNWAWASGVPSIIQL
jgi:hypothetical protein